MIVTNGAQQALHLVAHVLLEPGDAVWFEDPGYRGARTALQSAGLTIAPVPIDEEGLRVDEGVRRAPDARAAYVTPSHQYPLGVTMSLARRLRAARLGARAAGVDRRRRLRQRVPLRRSAARRRSRGSTPPTA